MGDRWSEQQVLALAPDPASIAAARKLGNVSQWSGLGASEQPALVWGECRGSGKSPYRTAVDMLGVDQQGPAFSCSCPSRKFPCKHALALLRLWSAGAVPDGEPADWAAGWLDQRLARATAAQTRAEAAAGRAEAGQTGPADPEAARKRAQQRADRMASGLDELDQWLADQVRTGLAGAQRAGYGPFDALAARMVDAQLPGVAGTVRRLAAVAVSGDGWPGRLLAEYALLHLLSRAARSTGALSGEQVTGEQASSERPTGVRVRPAVREHLGLTVATQDVLAGPAVRDRWTVLGRRDSAEERLTVRRVWLRGERTGRTALVLSFAPAGQQLDASLIPGRSIEADLHYYPSPAPLRALVGAQHGPPGKPAATPGTGLADGLRQWADALAADPWLRSWPVLLQAVPVLDEQGWWLVDDDGALPVSDPDDGVWTLLAVSGGVPVVVLAEIVPAGLRVLAADSRDARWVPL